MPEEPKAVASQEAQPSQEQKQEASEEQVQVPIDQTPEFKAALERRAQSEADKRVKVFEDKIKRLQQDLESAQHTATSRREESEIETLLSRYVENGDITEASVPPIRDFAKKTIERERQAREALRKAEEEVKEVAELKATRNVLKLAAEQGVSISFEDAESIAKETDGNVKWALDKILAKVTSKVKTPEKPNPKRPDSGAPTAPGGKLTDTELMARYGSGKISLAVYDRECKERGMPPA